MRDDTLLMIPNAFFDALLEYLHKESLLLQYAQRRAERSDLSRLDWDMINEARDENTESLHEVWQCVHRSDSSR